eukprot:TRINITY_DN27182_c0_g1_i1.p1 TRINITY_DN27182_c0_g1~~TRINITY_DN27182_c0_g1_i1.p1  ORF type:complete len:421 (-),score=51.98 TRINITY_DN27182_c0_g1_i1:288-1550(-)
MAEEPSDFRARQTKKKNKIQFTVNFAASEPAEPQVPNSTSAAASLQSNAASDENRLPSQVGKDLLEWLAKATPTRACIERKDRCMGELIQMVRHLGPEWDVRPFGSFGNGFGTVWSDLDVTCFQRDVDVGQEAQRLGAAVLGDHLLPMLQNHGMFSVKATILTARVPIIKLRFEDTLDVDLSCYNPLPLLNTRLLAAYARVHHTVKDLGIAVKLWAKKAGVCDASRLNLSSYSFTLLVLYFMQVSPDIKLPTLPVGDIAAYLSDEALEQAIAVASYHWQCKLPLPELLMRFFGFYAKIFQWGYEVVSVRLGQQISPLDLRFSKLRGRHVNRLHIEDPFQLERNLHCVLGDEEEKELRRAFEEALLDMQAGVTPKALRPTQGAPLAKASGSGERQTQSVSSDSTKSASSAGETGVSEEDDR